MNSSAFGFEKPEDNPGFLLWQTTITWQRLIYSELVKYDISHAQFVLLALLLWHQEKKIKTTQNLMIKISKLDKMTVSKSLKKLELLSYVKREELETDTRFKSLKLTSKGKNLVSKIIPKIEKIDEDFFSCIKNNELKNLVGYLKKINI